MEWQFVLALIIAIPLILFPAAFVWYLNGGQLFRWLREVIAKCATRRRAGRHHADEPGGAKSGSPGPLR